MVWAVQELQRLARVSPASLEPIRRDQVRDCGEARYAPNRAGFVMIDAHSPFDSPFYRSQPLSCLSFCVLNRHGTEILCFLKSQLRHQSHESKSSYLEITSKRSVLLKYETDMSLIRCVINRRTTYPTYIVAEAFACAYRRLVLHALLPGNLLRLNRSRPTPTGP
jgi:hypothetical protein